MASPLIAGTQNKMLVLKQMEGELTADGSLSAKDIEKLEKKATTPAEKKAVQNMIAADAWDSSVKGSAAQRKAHSPVVGKPVGNTTATRELGAPAGYLDRNQAIGAARLSGSPNAAVVQDANNRWHAIETKAPLTQSSSTAMAVKPIDYKALNSAQAAYDGLKANDPGVQNPDTRDALKKWAAVSLGVPETEINIANSPEKMRPGMVNVVINAPGDEGVTRPDISAKGLTANGITPSALRGGPLHAGTTLFHEGVHASDHERTLQLKAQFDKLDPKPINPYTKQPMEFGFWVSTQMSGNQLSGIEGKMTQNDGSKTAKELHAHVQAFMQSFGTDIGSAIGELRELNNDFTKGDVDGLTALSATQLRDFYSSLDPVGQVNFKSAYDAAMQMKDGLAADLMKRAFPEGLESKKPAK